MAKAQIVKTLAAGIGLDLVGVTHAGPLVRADHYRDWLAVGHGAAMSYLARNVPIRAEPVRILPGARSIICAALSHRREDGYVSAIRDRSRPAVTDEHGPAGLVAQYARGRDYHVVLRRMLDRLVAGLRERLDKPFDARVFVDTGPLLERELAARAGLGWIGKNTCLLNGQLGRCTRCLDACPARAFVGPHRLNAARCISYLTIEHRGPIAEELHAAMGDCVFGCDICQQVCPYNARAPLATDADVVADVLPARLALLDLLRLRSGDYRRLTRGSAARRAKRAMWRRNAAIALGNAGRMDAEIREALTAAREADDPGLWQAARASFERLA